MQCVLSVKPGMVVMLLVSEATVLIANAGGQGLHMARGLALAACGTAQWAAQLGWLWCRITCRPATYRRTRQHRRRLICGRLTAEPHLEPHMQHRVWWHVAGSNPV